MGKKKSKLCFKRLDVRFDNLFVAFVIGPFSVACRYDQISVLHRR